MSSDLKYLQRKLNRLTRVFWAQTALIGLLIVCLPLVSLGFESGTNFKPNTLISATAFNQRFQTIDNALTQLGVDQALTYSNNALYCGVTPNDNGDAGGYVGAKAACEAACGSPSAHLCVASELIRSESLDLNLPRGRYAVGGYSVGGLPINECVGFTIGLSDRLGPVWLGDLNQGPTTATCDLQLPYLCCD